MADKNRGGYVVLTSVDQAEWDVVGESNATSADDAIKDALSDGGASEANWFVAVPQRSWKPIKARLETRVVLARERPAPVGA